MITSSSSQVLRALGLPECSLFMCNFAMRNSFLDLSEKQKYTSGSHKVLLTSLSVHCHLLSTGSTASQSKECPHHLKSLRRPACSLCIWKYLWLGESASALSAGQMKGWSRSSITAGSLHRADKDGFCSKTDISETPDTVLGFRLQYCSVTHFPFPFYINQLMPFNTHLQLEPLQRCVLKCPSWSIYPPDWLT